MKKIVLFFLLLNFVSAQAQTAIFPDTLTILNSINTLGIDIMPLPTNKEYMILRRSGSPYIAFTKIDSLGQQIGNSEFRCFGNNKYIFPGSHSFLQLKNKNWLIPTFVQTVGVVDNYAGLVLFNQTLTDTLYTHISKFNYLGVDRNSSYSWLGYSYDSSSIWMTGTIQTPTSYITATVSHLDTNLNVISNYVLDRGTRYLLPSSILPSSDGKCIVSGQAQHDAGNGHPDDQVFIAKIGDNGLEWYKELGFPSQPDYDPYLFRGSTDTTYTLIFAKALRHDPVADGSAVDIYGMEFDNLGAVLDSNTIMTIGRYARIYSDTQLEDGRIIISTYGYSTGHYPRFEKISRNRQLLWTSRIPQPAIGQYTAWGISTPARLLPTTDGGFLCTGLYENRQLTPAQTIWIGKMDSTGCWLNGGCINATSPSLLNLPTGNLVKVFPNPATSFINFELHESSSNGNLEIFDAKGEVVKKIRIEAGVCSQTLSVADWPSGVYIYRYTAVGEPSQEGKFELLK